MRTPTALGSQLALPTSLRGWMPLVAFVCLLLLGCGCGDHLAAGSLPAPQSDAGTDDGADDGADDGIDDGNDAGTDDGTDGGSDDGTDGGSTPPPAQAPTITSVTNPSPGLGAGPSVFPTCLPANMLILGTNFDPAATVLLYLQAGGPSSLYATGTLGSLVRTGNTLLEGSCPPDPTPGTLLVVVRVTNPDLQFAEAVVTFTDTMVQTAVNLGVDLVANVDAKVAIDPSNPLRIAVCARAEALGTGLSIRVALALGSGAGLAAPTLIGPVQDLLTDLAERREPCVAYDGFGRLHLAYVVRVLGLVDTLVLLHSEDHGATWSTPVVVAVGLAGQIEGIDLVCGPHPSGGQCCVVTWVDTIARNVLCSCWQSAGLLTPLLSLASTVLVDELLDLQAVAHARACISPTGAVTVVWVRLGTGILIPVAPTLACATDFDGLGIGLGFGGTVAIGPAELGLATVVGASPEFGATAAAEIVCVPVGPLAGRLVLVQTRALAGQRDCVSRTSDDGGLTWSLEVAVHGPNVADQFQPCICVDRLTGGLVCMVADTSADLFGLAVRRLCYASSDGIVWGPSLSISAGASLCVAGDGDILEYGVRCGIAIHGGCGWAAWPDNSDLGSGPVDCLAAPFQLAFP